MELSRYTHISLVDINVIKGVSDWLDSVDIENITVEDWINAVTYITGVLEVWADSLEQRARHAHTGGALDAVELVAGAENLVPVI